MSHVCCPERNSNLDIVVRGDHPKKKSRKFTFYERNFLNLFSLAERHFDLEFLNAFSYILHVYKNSSLYN